MTGKKKTKGVTMDLSTFHENVDKEKKENWADLDDEENGPPGEVQEQGGHREDDRRYERQERYERRGASYDRDGDRRQYERRDDRRDGDRRGDDRRGGASDRNRIDLPQKPVPERPPYIAYVGNLAFPVLEQELESFFSEYCKVTNVRILINKETNRSKGFGYVTFADRESLVTALQANGEEIQGRKIRVDVADDMGNSGDRDFRGGDRRPPPAASRADAVDKWERGVAVPVKDTPPPSGRYNRSDRERNDREGGYERRYNSERGPAERKPLDLKPRSSPPSSGESSAAAAAPKASKPNPFGDARPRDEQLVKQREIEVAEKIKQDQQKTKEIAESTPPREKKPYQPPQRKEGGERSDRGGDRKPYNKYGNKSAPKQSNAVPKKYTTAQTKETKIATSNAFGDLNASVD